MASNTKFDPINVLEFNKYKLNKVATGVKGTMDKGTSTNLDYTLTDDVLIAGGHCVLADNVKWGDKLSFQIIHPVTGAVLSEFISNWYLNPDAIQQVIPTSNYPAKLSAGLIMRVVYTSVAESSDLNPELVVNYNLEKILE